MAIKEIKTVLVAHFDAKEKKIEHYLTNATWAVMGNDIALDENFMVRVNIPEHSQEELALKAINTLRAKQSKAWAEAQLVVNGLEEEIKKIQLLTHQPHSSIPEDFDTGDTLILAGTYTEVPQHIGAEAQTETDPANAEWEPETPVALSEFEVVAVDYTTPEGEPATLRKFTVIAETLMEAETQAEKLLLEGEEVDRITDNGFISDLI